MKKEFGKYVAIVLGIICVILAIALICIRVSSVNAQSSDKDLREKISEEISYLDSSISQLMNKMNNIDIIKYKVYTKQIDVPKEDESSSSGNSQESSGSSSENSSEGSSSQSGGENSSSGQTSGGQSQGQASSEGQGNTTNVSELVPSVTLEGNNEEIDWNQISFLVEKIYSIWPSVNLDLQKQGISSELISSFSLSMDGVIQSIKNKGTTFYFVIPIKKDSD